MLFANFYNSTFFSVISNVRDLKQTHFTLLSIATLLSQCQHPENLLSPQPSPNFLIALEWNECLFKQNYSSQILNFQELCSIILWRQQLSENGVGRRRRGAEVWLRPRSVCARNIELIGSPNRRWEWAPLTVDCLCFAAPPQSSTNAVDGELAPPDPQQEQQGEKMLFAKCFIGSVCLTFDQRHTSWFTSSVWWSDQF